MKEFDNILEFRKNFTHIYHSQVENQLMAFDNERINSLRKARVFKYLLLVLALGCIGFLIFGSKSEAAFKFFGTSAFLSIIGAFGVYHSIGKNFENKLKERIMPLLMKAFGNFTWMEISQIGISEIKTAELVDNSFEYQDVDDNFYGTYKNMPIRISEMELYYYTRDSKGRKHRATVFKGVMVMIDTGKIFAGHTIIRNRAFLFNKKVYQEVKLEDPEFQKQFFVDSTDQIESRVLLTPAFMERFKQISNAFGSTHPSCSFRDTKILLALPTNKDLFKLGKLDTPLTDHKAYETLLNEFVSILEMIDHLKLKHAKEV